GLLMTRSRGLPRIRPACCASAGKSSSLEKTPVLVPPGIEVAGVLMWAAKLMERFILGLVSVWVQVREYSSDEWHPFQPKEVQCSDLSIKNQHSYQSKKTGHSSVTMSIKLIY